MPSHVKIFAALGYFAIAYSVVMVTWHLTFPSPEYAAMLAKLSIDMRHLTLMMTIKITAFWVILDGMLLWFAAFLRLNAARWAYALVFALRQSAPLFLLLRGPDYAALVLKDYLEDLSSVRFYIAAVPVIAAIVFSFTGNANAWFRSRAA